MPLFWKWYTFFLIEHNNNSNHFLWYVSTIPSLMEFVNLSLLHRTHTEQQFCFQQLFTCATWNMWHLQLIKSETDGKSLTKHLCTGQNNILMSCPSCHLLRLRKTLRTFSAIDYPWQVGRAALTDGGPLIHQSDDHRHLEGVHYRHRTRHGANRSTDKRFVEAEYKSR